MTVPTQPNTIGIQIPNFLNSPVIEKRENGDYHWTPEWNNVMSQLFKQLQTNLSQEGIKTPQQTNDNITTLNTPQSKGAILYNSETDTFHGNVAGTFKTFTLT